jgi:putative ABC transport system permease protein
MEGDLEQLFQQRVVSQGKRKASTRYVLGVISLMRPFAMKEKPSSYPKSPVIQFAMIQNYFKISWRNLWKNKIFSAVNLMGLAVGITACLMILQYVSFELSFDQFQKEAAAQSFRRLR